MTTKALAASVAMAGLLGISGCVVEAVSAAPPGVAVAGPPPAPMVEARPAPPVGRVVWVAGYWHWTGHAIHLDPRALGRGAPRRGVARPPLLASRGGLLLRAGGLGRPGALSVGGARPGGCATLRVVRRALLWIPLLALAVTEPAAAGMAGPVLHEPIPPDAREDLAMHVALDGDLPAALQTPSGVVSAPDPRAPTSSADAAYGTTDADRSTFQPDRDTRRPEIARYDEPFTPSTAPFKRLQAYDAVREDYQLYVRDVALTPVPTGVVPAEDDEAFYEDLVVDVAARSQRAHPQRRAGDAHRARAPRRRGPGALLPRACTTAPRTGSCRPPG